MKYNTTSDYHWPDLELENTNAVVEDGNVISPSNGDGPFGFQNSLEISSGQCLVKTDFQIEHDECIMTPKKCLDGVSFSIWEKVHYKTDVFNVYKDHDRQYIFSTGGDYDYDQKKAYPGMALYHQGMNLVAVVSTGDDVWSLSVTGQLLNETWANIGVTWEPHKLEPGLAWAERGGLTLYVNAKKVGQAVMPLKRPTITQITPPVDLWIHAGELSPNPNDPTWTGVGKKAPVIMVGCHRNSDEYKFRGFLAANASYDELTIWTRKLRTNKSVDETLYFVGGYIPNFESVTPEEWLTMMDRVELSHYSQDAVASVTSQLYHEGFVAEDPELPDPWPYDPEWLNRTEEQRVAYYRQKMAFDIGRKLLNTSGLLAKERAKYLSRRFPMLEAVADLLSPTHANIDGWLSIQIDPNEDDSSVLVREIENFILDAMSTADIRHLEDFPPLFNATHMDMTMHWDTDAYTISSMKVLPNTLGDDGAKNNIRDYFEKHNVNPTMQWDTEEAVIIPGDVPFLNESLCADKPQTYLFTLYKGYGVFAPLKRNPTNIRANKIKIDSKPISVKMRVNQDPEDIDLDNLDPEAPDYAAECQIDHDEFKYNPVQIRFIHMDQRTSNKKLIGRSLMWHEDDLQTDIEVRRCAVFNEDLSGGSWDATHCTTVLTEQTNTVCECATFGTVAVIIEHVQPPEVDEEFTWLWITKYAGFSLSLLLLLVFVLVIGLSPLLWDQFHLMRLHAAICLFWLVLTMFLTEADGMCEDRHSNIAMSMLIHYWSMGVASFLFFESWAMFRAVTVGIIGGKTWAYIPLGYGLPFLNLGATLYMAGKDYGTDPRCMIGWENETKMIFFYGMLPGIFISTLLCFVVIFNLATPQTRRDGVIDRLSSMAQGLVIVVFIHSATWGFSYPAFIRFPDIELSNFYPIFTVLNAFIGVFLFAFMGLGDRRFRLALMAQSMKQKNLMMGYSAKGSDSDSEESDSEEEGDEGQNDFAEEDDDVEKAETRPPTAMSNATAATNVENDDESKGGDDDDGGDRDDGGDGDGEDKKEEDEDEGDDDDGESDDSDDDDDESSSEEGDE